MNNFKKMVVGMPILLACLSFSYLIVTIPKFALMAIGIVLFLLASSCIGDAVLVYYNYKRSHRRNEKKHAEN